MSSRRVWLVHGLLASILALTTFSFVRREPFWPVSHYPMFSGLRTRADATALEVYVVDRRGEWLLPREDGTWTRDFDGVGVQRVVTRIAAADGPDGETSRRFLAALLGELQRRARERGVEAPAALRLYRVVWRFADSPTLRRDAAARTLLTEVPGAGAR